MADSDSAFESRRKIDALRVSNMQLTSEKSLNFSLGLECGPSGLGSGLESRQGENRKFSEIPSLSR